MTSGSRIDARPRGNGPGREPTVAPAGGAASDRPAPSWPDRGGATTTSEVLVRRDRLAVLGGELGNGSGRCPASAPVAVSGLASTAERAISYSLTEANTGSPAEAASALVAG